MEKTDENIEEILNKFGVKNIFLSNLETYITESGFKIKLNAYISEVLKNIKIEEITEDRVYKIIMEYISKNLPIEVQERLYGDIRTFLDENIEF